jgi:hypothetical protein
MPDVGVLLEEHDGIVAMAVLESQTERSVSCPSTTIFAQIIRENINKKNKRAKNGYKEEYRPRPDFPDRPCD